MRNCKPCSMFHGWLCGFFLQHFNQHCIVLKSYPNSQYHAQTAPFMILSAAPNNRRYPLWRSYLNSSRLLVILVGALDNCHACTLDSWYQELLAPRFEFRTLVQWNHWWHRIKPQTMDTITGKRSYLNSIKSHGHPHTQKCAWRSHFNIIMCEVILRWFKRPMKSNYVSHQHSVLGWL